MSPLSLYAVIALVAATLSGVGAWNVQAWRYAAKDASRIEAQAELSRNDRKAAQSASEGFENDKAKTEIKYRTITRDVEKIVERPLYRNVCFDDGGLRAVRDALGTAGDTGQPQGAVPESR